MAYDDATAQRIDRGLETAYQNLKTAIRGGQLDQGKTAYRTAIEGVVQQHFAGDNHEASLELIENLGFYQDVDNAIAKIRDNPRLSGQEKDSLLAKATSDGRMLLLQSFGIFVPSPNEGTRPARDQFKIPLASYRLEELIRRIRP